MHQKQQEHRLYLFLILQKHLFHISQYFLLQVLDSSKKTFFYLPFVCKLKKLKILIKINSKS
ncbi:MAG TPA: hypothetical protein DDY52_04865 [Candidatus Moranbacteria bacterium]|nr:hypothetical protein [Candidatus Moranbacteria bacterium]